MHHVSLYTPDGQGLDGQQTQRLHILQRSDSQTAAAAAAAVAAHKGLGDQDWLQGWPPFVWCDTPGDQRRLAVKYLLCSAVAMQLASCQVLKSSLNPKTLMQVQVWQHYVAFLYDQTLLVYVQFPNV